MRLGPGLLYEGRTLQGARPKLAHFCSATMAEFYSAVDILDGTVVRTRIDRRATNVPVLAAIGVRRPSRQIAAQSPAG